MKKTIILFCLVIFCLVSFGQVYQEMPQYGYRANRMVFDSTLSIPSVCGVPTLKSNLIKKAAIAFDSCNNRFYYYNPKTKVWSQVSGGGASFDSTSLSNRIDLKIDSLKRFSDSVYAYHNGIQVFQYRDSTFDSTSLSNRINLKVNISDTSTMLGNYLRKIDTLSLSNRINLKVNIADTSAMLSPYLHSVDTANKWIQSITRTAGKDSIIFYKGGVRFAIKDSVGGGGQNGRFGNDTATVVMVKIHNDAGVTLTNGKVVALTMSGNNNESPAVRLANSKHDSTSANTLGFVTGSIANQDTGWVILSGKIEKLNTAAYSNGDIIYLDTISGSYTKVKPQAPTHLVYLGVVVKSNAGNGAIFVKCQNGYELDEIHDVQINSKLNNQVLAYSDTQKVWKNRNIYAIVDTSTTIATKTNFALKVNISDTASMLTNYAKTSAVNLKVNISDTASMLTNYVRTSNLDWNVNQAYQALGSSVKSINLNVLTVGAITTNLVINNAQLYLVACYIPKATTITGVKWYVAGKGTYVANNYNGFGLYSYSGGTLTRVDSTVNDGTIFTAPTANTWSSKAFAFTYSASIGVYYIAFLANNSSGSVSPYMGCGAATANNATSTFDFTNSAKLAGYITSQSLLPTTITMSSVTNSYQPFGIWLY